VRTPGTNLDWATLQGWLDCVDALERRHRCSRRAYDQEAAHWAAFAPYAKAWIAAADKATCERLLARIGGNNRAWGRKCRGWRGGTQWEWVNVEVRNRLWRLEREADRATMGLGDNARAFL